MVSKGKVLGNRYQQNDLLLIMVLGSTSPPVANAAAYKTYGVQHELTGVLFLPWAALNQLIHTCLCRALVVDDQVTTAAGESKEVGTVAQSELASLDIGDAQFRAWRWHTAIGRTDMAMLSNLDFLASNVSVCESRGNWSTTAPPMLTL